MENNTQRREIHFQPPSMVVKAATVALAALAIWAFIGAMKGLREYRYIGAGTSASNTISVSGQGEAFAVPDIATFTVGVTEEAETVEEAQTAATEKINNIIDALEEEGIEERDIQTTNYNVYPRYEYQQNTAEPGFRPPEGQRVLVGFEVSQSLRVKVRDTESAGQILSRVGSLGATNVSGLSFTIDDEDAIKREAREKAITDAKEKAQQLADDLEVGLVRIVGFNESGGGYPEPMYRATLDSAVGMGGAESAPQLPTGENKVTSNVNLVYEIR